MMWSFFNVILKICEQITWACRLLSKFGGDQYLPWLEYEH